MLTYIHLHVDTCYRHLCLLTACQTKLHEGYRMLGFLADLDPGLSLAAGTQ